jgi:hypothetical protein
MNKILSAHARGWLKANLAQCTEPQIDIFRRMYSHKDLDKAPSEVVDLMPDDKLDWAMSQVASTLDKAEIPHATPTLPAYTPMLEALELAEEAYKLGIFDAPGGMLDRVVELRRAAIALAKAGAP